MTADAIARELAEAMVDSCITWGESKVNLDVPAITTLITRALKQYGNNRLEEAAAADCGKYRGTKINSFLTGVESKNMAILALKEPI